MHQGLTKSSPSFSVIFSRLLLHLLLSLVFHLLLSLVLSSLLFVFFSLSFSVFVCFCCCGGVVVGLFCLVSCVQCGVVSYAENVTVRTFETCAWCRHTLGGMNVHTEAFWMGARGAWEGRWSSASCVSLVKQLKFFLKKKFLEHLNWMLGSSIIAKISAYHEWPTVLSRDPEVDRKKPLDISNFQV